MAPRGKMIADFWTVCTTVLCLLLCIRTVVTDEENSEYWRQVGRYALRRAITVARHQNKNLARNIVLFIGDGMGISTVTAARIRAGQMNNRSGEENLLFFERFPHTGLMKTYNVDAQVPDSGGAGTAIMTGVKANTGVIGCDARVSKGNCSAYNEDSKLRTILHAFTDKGLSTGIVSNSRVTHATPASAYAHTPNRGWEGDVDLLSSGPECRGVDDIAKQLVMNNADIKVILGGGRRYFLDNTTADPETGEIDPYQRRDGLNLIQEWEKDKENRGATHSYVWNKTQFDQLDLDNTDYLLGLFSPSHMDIFDEETANNETELSLADMTEAALKVLEKDNRGYFLMVEGARIDWGHHVNSAYTAIHETIAMDEAVERAFLRTSRRDTLILVTADHSHAFSIQGYAPRGHDILGVTAPDSNSVPLDGLPYTTLGYTNGPFSGRHDVTGVETDSPDYRQPGCVPLGVETHAGEDVAAYAVGPMAHLLHGTQEQNYLYHIMEYAACVGYSERYCSNSYTHDRHG
ncbi:alkaline phosphatase, tissue-nonspecific isozyme [Aplysia californica]|uniref:Alkaline phosphatase n=1 Tax=Aplysia californica TaxID=6500 RepID=A0ABM1A8K9_APLCA|nr:alkaline phosphatase, tissue-nonspecific isozyme [Aplysia californica]